MSEAVGTSVSKALLQFRSIKEKKKESGNILSKAGEDHHIEQLNFPFNDNEE